MNALDKHYTALLEEILEYGTKKQTRNGEVLSLFGRQIRHRMNEGFPLLTTKKMFFKGIVTELLWFLRGDTDIRYLWEHDCHIWDGDYEKSGRTDFQLGPIYGKQWRKWSKINFNIQPYEGPGRSNGNLGYTDLLISQIDQIQNLINDLKTNPDSRRLMVNAWNVGELDQMVLPPCHYGFQVYTRELSYEERIELTFKSIESTDGNNAALLWELSCQGKEQSEIVEALNNSPRSIPTRAISLIWNQRSVDTFLGLPFNIASYGLLLMILAKEANMVPDELIGNLGDVHLYSNHIEQAKEQISREPYELPKLKITAHLANKEKFDVYWYTHSTFVLEEYKSHPAIKAPLSN